MVSGVEIEAYSEQDMKDAQFGKKVIDVLAKHYPDHPWYVEASTVGGHVTIQLLYLDRLFAASRMGMLLHMNKLQNEADISKNVMLAGGELLERRKIKREAARPETFMQAKLETYDKSGMIR